MQIKALPRSKFRLRCARLRSAVSSRPRLAFDKFMEATQSTMNTFEGQSKVAQAGAKEVSQKIMGFAEQNVANAFEYAQKLVQAKDPQTLIGAARRVCPVADAGPG